VSEEEQKKNQCEATFTFSLGISAQPFIKFRCMRDKHMDGKHEHCGVSEHGWDDVMSWTEPQRVTIKSDELVFMGKESWCVQ